MWVRVFESKTPVRIPKGKSTPSNIAILLSAGILFNFPSAQPGCKQDATGNYESISSPDNNISRKGRNNLDSLITRECSLHLVDFNIRKPNHIGLQGTLGRINGTFKIDVGCVLQNTYKGPIT